MQVENDLKNLMQTYPEKADYIQKLIKSAALLKNEKVYQNCLNNIEEALKNKDHQQLIFLENMIRRMHIIQKENHVNKTKYNYTFILITIFSILILLTLSFYFLKHF